MTLTDGQQILSSLIETKNFLKQVALLVRTADDQIQNAGWEIISSNKCTKLTGHVHQPENWVPNQIYRFYQMPQENGEHQDSVLFFGVLLTPDTSWAGFTEPWVTCGLYQFCDETAAKEFAFWDWVDGHLYEKKEPDGQFYAYPLSKEQTDETSGLIYQATTALPLVAITSAAELEEKIINPLLQLVKLDS